MANVMGGNPLVIDTTGATSAFAGRVRLIQWVDDNGDILDDSTLVLSINGATITGKLQMAANVNPSLVVWQIGPFNPGIYMSGSVTTMATGMLHIWMD